MEKVMTLTELKKHIEETALPLIQGVSTKVGDLVKEQIEKALQPIRDGLTAAEVARMEIVDKIKAASTGKSPIGTGKREREKGESFGRVVWALRRAKNDPTAAAALLDKTGDGDLAELMKAEAKLVTEKSMLAGDPETGGILIPQPVSAEVIELLRSAVVVRRMNPVILPMPSGNFNLPKVTQGTTAYYTGEAAAATTSKVKTGSVKLSWKKLVTVVPASNDLFRYSSPGADMLIRDDITRNMSVREDQAFLRDDGTNGTPKGLLQWAIDNNQAINATGGAVSLANVTTDLGTTILKLMNANVPMTRAGWLMSPRTWNYLSLVRTTNGPFAFRDEILRGTLLGFPFAITTQIPITLDTSGAGNNNETDLYLADFADVVIGDSQNLIIDASGDASYEEGGTTKSAFHRDETVIRAIHEHDIVLRRQESIAVMRRIIWI